MTDLIKLLLVEDDDKHFEDAQAEIARRKDNGARIEVDTARNLAQGLELLDGMYDAIISDIFFDSGLDETRTKEILQKLEKVLRPHLDKDFHGKWWDGKAYDLMNESINKWASGKTQAPLGVYLALQKTEKTPFVFCTNTHHHNVNNEPIHRYRLSSNLDMADRCDNYISPPMDNYVGKEHWPKLWSEAYQMAAIRIAESKIGVGRGFQVKGRKQAKKYNDFMKRLGIPLSGDFVEKAK